MNVWASWCVPCQDEVPFLEQLAQDKRVQLVGINYKDSADNARRFLGRYGNPYRRHRRRTRTAAPAIDWGVYGVPETFVVGRDGRIAYKLVGPITAENLASVLEPEIAEGVARATTVSRVARQRSGVSVKPGMTSALARVSGADISAAADTAARRTATSAAARRTA